VATRPAEMIPHRNTLALSPGHFTSTNTYQYQNNHQGFCQKFQQKQLSTKEMNNERCTDVQAKVYVQELSYKVHSTKSNG